MLEMEAVRMEVPADANVIVVKHILSRRSKISTKPSRRQCRKPFLV